MHAISSDVNDVEDVSLVWGKLRDKWKEVPSGLLKRSTSVELMGLDDKELKNCWVASHEQYTVGEGYSARGWYQDIYRDALVGKSVADVGSGLGIDGLHFAMNGANVTFIDIVEDNLDLIRRLSDIFQLKNVDFLYLDNFDSIDSLGDFDVIWCQGSMIHAPLEFVTVECTKLLEHLKAGGRWIELCYPKERWIREGCLPFSEWGNSTDGEGTPWAEWYDIDKLMKRLGTASFDIVLNQNFHNDDFVWFDLKKRF